MEIEIKIKGKVKKSALIAEHEPYAIAYVGNPNGKHNLVIGKHYDEGYRCTQIGNEQCLNWLLHHWLHGFREAFEFLVRKGIKVEILVNREKVK